VTQYLRNYTREQIGMVVGIPTLRQILEEKYYADLPGGLLEGLGRLFSGPVKLLVYPTIEAGSEGITTVDTLEVASALEHLYAYLRTNGFIEPIRRFDAAFLHVSPSDVLAKIQTGDSSWETMVPSKVFQMITQKRLFGYSEAETGRRHADGSDG
jgi:hypothetical protein